MATSSRTPYNIFNVSEDIGYVDLRTVYRDKIHEHKEKKISAIQFRRICRAYETLSDFNKREHYDTTKEWISELPLDQYTPQQLAAEPDLIRDFKQRVRKLNLTQLNAKDPNTNHTLLYTGARGGNLEAVKFLTEQGADSDLQQRTGSTALHAASYFGHPEIVRCLLEGGANYKIVNSSDNMPDDEAYTHEVKEEFNRLRENPYVRAAANELDWFIKNGLKQHQDTEFFSHRQTLLHCASKKGYFELVKWLVKEQSANVDLVDFNGNSPLHLAAFGGHREIVDYLLNRGCDPTLRNRWGTTAEEEGSKHGRRIINLFKLMRRRNMFEMVRDDVAWWFYYYFDIKLKDAVDSSGRSLLYYASSYGKYDVVKWLLSHGANVNIQMETKPQSTALHGAKYRGHWKIVELLLEYGADVNIRNGFNLNVFEDEFHTDVDETSSRKINEILQQYLDNLREDKVIDIYIYEDGELQNEPTKKIKLAVTAKKKDLLKALSTTANNEYPYFSIAGHLLFFPKESTTVISAVGCARYTFSKFIENPIRLVGHKQIPEKYKGQQPRHSDFVLQLRDFDNKFMRVCQEQSCSLKAPLTEEKRINIGNLTFILSANCINADVELQLETHISPDFEIFGIHECICLFRTKLGKTGNKFVKLPEVLFKVEPNARLYTFANGSSYWFTSETRQNHLPMIGGIHAFIRHVDIIPGHLKVPPDMFIASSLQQPLIWRNDPVRCKYLHIRAHDSQKYPHKVYHGTNIEAVESILINGLVLPGTVVCSGKRINPPDNHIARQIEAFDIADFAGAIFLSPSIHYSSDSTYARPFFSGDQQLIPVLECSVKERSYRSIKCTTWTYEEHSGDDLDTIEWRVPNPNDVEINGVLFIITDESVAETKECRIIRYQT